jgi:hypothetical protein
MYYRIEVINEYSIDNALRLAKELGIHMTVGHKSKLKFSAYKHGLCGITTDEVVSAWIDDIMGPTRAVNRNCRFFFTEKGFDTVGRKVIAACIKSEQKYRVIRIKNHEWDVVWKGELEAALRPRKKRERERKDRKKELQSMD